MSLIKEIGAIAGFSAFFGLAVLAVLYFAQSRDLRRLREWAGRAPEREARAGTPRAVAQQAQSVVAEPAQGISQQRLRESQQAREAALRREREAAQRAQQRRREPALAAQGSLGGVRSAGRGAPRRLGQYRYLLAAIAAVLVLGALVTVGALAVLGGGSSSRPAAKRHAVSSPNPGQITVSVLNGTSTPGLAAQFGNQVQAAGFKRGQITNTQGSFTTSVVMFAPGHRPDAELVAKQVGIGDVAAVSQSVASVSGSSDVSVVVGEDQASSSSSSSGASGGGASGASGAP